MREVSASVSRDKHDRMYVWKLNIQQLISRWLKLISFWYMDHATRLAQQDWFIVSFGHSMERKNKNMKLVKSKIHAHETPWAVRGSLNDHYGERKMLIKIRTEDKANFFHYFSSPCTGPVNNTFRALSCHWYLDRYPGFFQSRKKHIAGITAL